MGTVHNGAHAEFARAAVSTYEEMVGFIISLENV